MADEAATPFVSSEELKRAYETLRFWGEHPLAAAELRNEQGQRALSGFQDLRIANDPSLRANYDAWHRLATMYYPPVTPYAAPTPPWEDPSIRVWEREKP